ncbi:MAG: hypothetical protein ACXV3D_06530, partial [Halobacteriota archaeon]
MIYLLLAFIAVINTSVGQVLIKIGSRKGGFHAYYNRAFILSGLMFPITFLCSLVALQGLELKLFAAISSLSYAIVVLLSALIIKERLSWQKITAV